MGRHFTDLSKPAGRLPSSRAEGVSWPEMPLYHLPIPPIDNAHVLHFGRAGSLSGRYTVHMYFLPEETYLAWETEPPQL